MLCYVSRVRIRATKTFGHRHDRACTDFSPVEIDRRAKFGCCVIRMLVGKGHEFFWGRLDGGVADSYKHATPSHVTEGRVSAEFVRSMPNGNERNYGDPPEIFDFSRPVIQGHWNRHGSIGYL